jgi:hypothetical protein
MNVNLTPPALLRKLTQPMKKGGSEAEAEYAEWHKKNKTQKLKKKYRE